MNDSVFACLFFCCLSFSLFADEQAFTVDAKVMEFDGNTQVLHARDVVVAFKNGAKLMSRSAELDFETLKGVMSSGRDDELVVFTGLINHENEKSRPIVVKGRIMTVEIENSEDSPSKQLIEVVGEQDVEIMYDRDFTAYGDRVIFQNEKSESSHLSTLTKSGILTLEGSESEPHCRIEHKNGDVIEARRMRFLPFENEVDCWDVKGSLTSIGTFREIMVQSEHVRWLPKQKTIRLEGKSTIVDEEIGKLASHGILDIIRGGLSDKDSIKQVVAHGEIRFDQCDGEHSLGGFGEMILDYPERKLTVISPKDINGMTILSQQAYYQDSIGKIFADVFEIYFDVEKGKVMPRDVKVRGHVRMQNQYIFDPSVRDVLEQYALADVVTYSPITKKMTLQASKGKRVLYYDKVRGIQVSAPGLFVVRGSKDELEVRGKGNVRMKFTQNEISELQKYFPFLK